MGTPVTLLRGHWVGPETTACMQRLVAAAGADIEWESFDAVSPEFFASARRTGLILKNRLDHTPKAGVRSPAVAIRKELGLWAQVRHVKNLPGLPARFDGVDVMVVRETSEDIYSGFEHETAEGVFESVKLTTAAACERIAVFAFETARKNGRKKVTIAHKSNIMKKSDGLFLRTAQAVGARYPDIACDEVIVDAMCMKLVRWPQSFDVLVCGNLYGDILGDLAAGLAGGIAVGGSVSVGDGVTMFDNPHGKAPEIVGTGRANPVPQLVITLRLLEKAGQTQAAARLERALHAALPGLRTVDQGGTDGIAQVEAAILAGLR